MTMTATCIQCESQAFTRAGVRFDFWGEHQVNDQGNLIEDPRNRIIGPAFCSDECMIAWLVSISSEADINAALDESRRRWGAVPDYRHVDIPVHDMSTTITGEV